MMVSKEHKAQSDGDQDDHKTHDCIMSLSLIESCLQREGHMPGGSLALELEDEFKWIFSEMSLELDQMD